MAEIDIAKQHGHNMEVEFINNKDAFSIGYKSFLAGYSKAKNEAKEIIKTFLGFAEAFGYSPSMDKFITEAEQFIN